MHAFITTSTKRKSTSPVKLNSVHNNIMIGRHNKRERERVYVVTYSVYLQVSIVIKVESNFPVTTDPQSENQ